MGYVKLSGTTNRHENWTTEYVVEVDEETGEPTKVVRQGEPVDLNKEQQEKLEALGAIFEDSSADEAKEFRASAEQVQPAGADTAAGAPLLGAGGNQPNQTVDQPEGKSSEKSK